MDINCRNWCNVFRYHGEAACNDDRCPFSHVAKASNPLKASD